MFGASAVLVGGALLATVLAAFGGVLWTGRRHEVRADGGGASGAAAADLDTFEDEELVYDLHPSWSRWGNLILVSVPMILVFGIGLLGLAYVFFARKSTHYFVTNYRLVERTGLLGRYTVEHDIDDLNWLRTGRNWLGAYTGEGSVEASAGSGSTVQFGGIPDYAEVARYIRMRQRELDGSAR